MRTFSDIAYELNEMSNMSCKPTTPKPRVGDVIDEEKSVRWNREEIERRIVAYEDEVKELNRKKNDWRDKLYKETISLIKKNVKGISDNDAKRIYEYVRINRDDWESTYNDLEELVDVVDSIVNKKNDK